MGTVNRTNGNTNKKKNKSSSIKKWAWALIGIILMAIGGVLGKDIGKYFTKRFLRDKNISAQITKMQRHVVGSTKLSILSPGIFKERPLVLPENVKTMVKKFKNYEYRYEYKVAVSCSEVIYSSGIIADAKGAVKNVISSLSNLNGVVNMKHSEKSISLSGCDGFEFLATYIQYNASIKAKGIVVTKGSKMWQVSIFYPSTLKESDRLADKILKSIEINN